MNSTDSEKFAIARTRSPACETHALPGIAFERKGSEELIARWLEGNVQTHSNCLVTAT